MTDEQQFVADLKRTLDAGNEKLTPALRNELARRRHQSLEQARSHRWHWWWLPAGAAAAALFAVLVVRPMGGTALPVAATMEADVDVDIVLAGESLDMYEDLEFFVWLSERGEAG